MFINVIGNRRRRPFEVFDVANARHQRSFDVVQIAHNDCRIATTLASNEPAAVNVRNGRIGRFEFGNMSDVSPPTVRERGGYSKLLSAFGQHQRVATCRKDFDLCAGCFGRGNTAAFCNPVVQSLVGVAVCRKTAPSHVWQVHRRLTQQQAVFRLQRCDSASSSFTYQCVAIEFWIAAKQRKPEACLSVRSSMTGSPTTTAFRQNWQRLVVERNRVGLRHIANSYFTFAGFAAETYEDSRCSILNRSTRAVSVNPQKLRIAN